MRLPTQVCQPAVTIASTDDVQATAITMAMCLVVPPLPNGALLSASASNPVHSLTDSSSIKFKPSNYSLGVCLLPSALHCLK